MRLKSCNQYLHIFTVCVCIYIYEIKLMHVFLFSWSLNPINAEENVRRSREEMIKQSQGRPVFWMSAGACQTEIRKMQLAWRTRTISTYRIHGNRVALLVVAGSVSAGLQVPQVPFFHQTWYRSSWKQSKPDDRNHHHSSSAVSTMTL